MIKELIDGRFEPREVVTVHVYGIGNDFLATLHYKGKNYECECGSEPLIEDAIRIVLRQADVPNGTLIDIIR